MIFRRFPTTFRRFPKIFQNCPEDQTNVSEHFPRISEDVRRLPKTFEEDPKMFRWYTNEFKYNLRDKPDATEIIDIFTCEDIVSFLWICYYSLYHWLLYNKYMLFAGWEVRIVKNCDRGLENAARGRRPRAAFSSPRSQFFTIRTDPKPANNLFIFFLR